MDPLSATASIIAILQLSAKVLSYLNNVKDASKGHAQCTIEASNIHNLLTNLRFRLEEGHGHQLWFTAVQALAVENGPLDQFKQALEILQAKMTDGGRLKKFGKALLWKFKKEELDAILAQMERLKTLTEIALQIDHFKLSQAIKDDIDSVRTDISAMQSTIDKFQHTQATASQRAILDWLSSSDYPAQQSDIIKRRQEGTGQWFLDTPEVTQWLKEAKATLFCPGIPGAGKTMVAAITIDQLLDSAPNGGYGVAYVYCNYKSQRDQHAAGMLAAMLKQLGQSRPSALGPVERLHQKYSSQRKEPSIGDICSVLTEVVSQLPRVYVVVDALDECQSETRRELVTKLRDLQAVADVRLMATSRFVPDIEDAFRLTPRLEVKASVEDVKLFVAGQTLRLPACIQRNAVLQEMVQEKIVEAVDGMFLLARLHLDSLVDKRTVKDVKATLAKFLKGAAALDGVYSDALTRIEGQLDGDQTLAKKVLTWITFAKRPLTTGEICCALAVEPGETELDPENKPDLDDILSVCAGLVVVDRESAIIHLVHYTTQEYFERNSFRISPDGEVPIAEICLTYLLFSVFESGSCATDKQLEERLSQHELLDYAAKHGGEHARYVEDKVAHLLHALLAHNGIFSCAAQVLLLSGCKYRAHCENESEFTGLHWAARFGLCKVANEFLGTTGKDDIRMVNLEDGDRRVPLVHAAQHGHCEVATLLLDNGADVNASYLYSGNALQLALSEGHMQFAEMLLEQGASVNTLGAEYSSELQVAAEGGHDLFVEKLLNAGAYVNAQSGYFGTALYAASLKGHEKVVKMLLDAGADVNAPGDEGRSALDVASEEGHEKVVKLLLDAGANLNELGRGGPLAAASLGGHTQVVELLLDAYGNSDINDVGGDDALYMAALEGHEKVVKMLLDAGADVDVRVGAHGNALQAASYKGHKQIVKLLLDKRANVNAQGGHYGTALQAASLIM